MINPGPFPKIGPREPQDITILRKVQKIFRWSDGHGWNIPKMHGMMKMTEYIKLFGSGINFYGGPGESHHKYFVKAPGDLTQRRVSEFHGIQSGKRRSSASKWQVAQASGGRLRRWCQHESNIMRQLW